MVVRMRRISTVLLLALSGLCQAQTAAPELGSLFTNTTERQTLSRMRSENLLQVDVSSPSPSPSPSLPLSATPAAPSEKRSQSIVINGLVQHGNRDGVVWINGERVDGASGPDEVRVYSSTGRDGKVVVGVMNRRAVALKPGQRLQVDNGKVEESYEADVKNVEATVVEP